MQKDGRVFQAGEDLIEEITSHAEAFAVEASLEGAVRIAPAAALMRSAHLLDEAIACARVGAAEALCLAIRSLVETTLYGHYLLAEGLDALQRMAAEQADQIQRIGRRLDSSQEKITQAVEGLVGLPGPHTLATIAERVDRAAGVPEGVKGLAQQGYDTLYGPLSNLVAHGGLGVLNDYVNDEDSHLRVDVRAVPLIDPGEAVALAAGLVGSLAMRVFTAFNLDTARLETLAEDLSPADQSTPAKTPSDLSFAVDSWPPAKSEALSMLGPNHPHAPRVHSLLKAAQAAMQQTGWTSVELPVGLDVVVSAPPDKDPWDATNYLGGIADVLQDKSRPLRGLDLTHLGELRQVAVYRNDRQIRVVRYRHELGQKACYIVRIHVLGR